MNPLIAGLLALATLGGPTAAFIAAPTCTDIAGQADVCQEVVVDVHPTPPVAAAAAPTCQDLAGHGHVCAEADPATGVFVDVLVVV